ncbi:MAG: hypothetical protein AMXMBFR84_42400 [Candidatus Hydrogenedentota bacterium]
MSAAFPLVTSPEYKAHLPYLSHSRVNRYLLCPEQYRLYYIEGLRPRISSASLEFGHCIHHALAGLFQSEKDPISLFLETWDTLKDVPLQYSRQETWDKLRERGQMLLSKFVLEEHWRISCVEASERPFELEVSSLETPLVGIIDLVARVEGVVSVVDFKTSGSAYQDHESALSDQLTAYQIAVPHAKQCVFCVFVKTKEPRIEWHYSTRIGRDLMDYLTKVGLVGRQIAAGQFYKRPGKWCAQCDFLPVCLGDRKRVEETLTTV